MIVKKPEKKNVATNSSTVLQEALKDPPRVGTRVEPSRALPPKILLLTDKQKAGIAMLNKLLKHQ